MKSFIIASVLLSLIVFATADEQDPCHGVRDGIFIENPESCSAYFLCYSGNSIPGACPPPFYFNFWEQICDWPENVDCINPPSSTTTQQSTEEQTDSETTSAATEAPESTTTEEPTESTLVDETSTTQLITETTTETVTEAPSVCYGINNGVLVGSNDCWSFFHCVDNLGYKNTCPIGLLFNGDYCDLEERVNCETSTTEEIPVTGTDDDRTTEPETTTVQETEPVTDGPIDPTVICVDKPDGLFINNPESCAAFFYCYNGTALQGNCPDPFYFNPEEGICDWPHNVDCSDETPPPSTELPTTTEESISETTTVQTTTDSWVDTENPETADETTEVTENPPPSICLPDEVGLHPHSTNCGQYILCFNGQSFELSCASGEHFSSEKIGCVAKEIANCRLEDPVCDPIESANRVVYFPHPHFCDRFFVCFRGDLLSSSCNDGYYWDVETDSCVPPNESTCEA